MRDGEVQSASWCAQHKGAGVEFPIEIESDVHFGGAPADQALTPPIDNCTMVHKE